MAVNINVPSQVKTYTDLAAFPASGALKTIYIAEDTNKTYRWTGSVYVEVSAAGASGITIGTTAITSGTVGRVLFEGTGNVVQESANLFWDNTNGRLGIGTSSPAFRLEVQGGDVRFANGLTIGTAGSTGWQFSSNTLTLIQNGFLGVDVAGGREFNFTNTSFSTTYLKLASFTGNVLINTTTDAGFKLDVNGTARVRGNFQVGVGSEILQLYTGNYRSFIDGSGTGIMNIRVLTTNVMTITPSGVVMNLAGETFVNASSIFELVSTTKGFLKPRLTTTQKNAISSPAAGLEVYDTTLNRPCFYDGTTWITL